VIAVGAMLFVLVVLTTVIHYEALGMLSRTLPRLGIAARAKLVVVILATFGAHALQILLYGAAIYALADLLGDGALGPSAHPAFLLCLYFSAETFTSLGYGDIVPGGTLRLLAGGEALNGLLLIGWSASYMYLSMEKYWNAHAARPERR
jgi:ion channel